MLSLHAELAAVPDFRRAQGRKHAVACVLAMHVLAELANMKGCLAAAQFARSLSQAELITERADYVFAVKGNSPETFGILDSIDWERDAAGRFEEDVEKAHGRLEQRSIRVIRYREPLKKDAGAEDGKDHIETAYLITSLDAKAASPEDLLRLNRGHWTVENLNHRQRDCVFGEDASA